MKKAIIISCFHGWYNNRLKPIIKYLEDRRYQVKSFSSDFDHIKKEYVNTVKEKNCFYIHVPYYKKNISINRVISHLIFGIKIKKILKKEKPDLVYVLVPPNNVAKYCAKYKKKYPQTKLIIDIIDLWPESIPLRNIKYIPFTIIWKKWRNDAIKLSDYVFTECNLFQKKLKGILNTEKINTLFLFKEQSIEEENLVEEIIKKRKNKCYGEKKPVRFAYLGSMNNIIDIEGICSVIRKFKNKRIDCELHAVGDGESKSKFEEAVKQIKCDTHFYGSIFDEIEKIKILSPCDYALNMMKENISVGLTIKSIDYLSYGLPLINNVKGDTWSLIETTGIGINIGNFIYDDFEIDHNYVKKTYLKYFTKDSFESKVRDLLDRLI